MDEQATPNRFPLRLAAICVILAPLVYFGGVEVALLYPFKVPTVRLSSQDVIALASGMVTAMGLVAIVFQFREARRVAADQAQQQERMAALRVDQLHVEWNLEAMHKHRDLAWRYFIFLNSKPEEWRTFARSWVFSEGIPKIPKNLFRAGDKYSQFSPYNWAVSSIIAFFVRLETHLRIHSPVSQGISDEELSELVGPFFWKYWEEYLVKMADCCEEAYLEDSAEAKEWPYFIEPVRALQHRTVGVGKPPARVADLIAKEAAVQVNPAS